MYSAGLLSSVFLLVLWSIWLRVCHKRQSITEANTKASPLSLAIQELVATAGGVYLSLIMLVSFLKLDLPPSVSIITVSVDPLALASLCIAIIQPIFTNMIIKLYK